MLTIILIYVEIEDVNYIVSLRTNTIC